MVTSETLRQALLALGLTAGRQGSPSIQTANEVIGSLDTTALLAFREQGCADIAACMLWAKRLGAANFRRETD